MRFKKLAFGVFVCAWQLSNLSYLSAQSQNTFLPQECSEAFVVDQLGQRLPALQESPRFSSQDHFAVDSKSTTLIKTRDFYFLSHDVLKAHHKKYASTKDKSRVKYLVANHLYPVDLSYIDLPILESIRTEAGSPISCRFKVGECVAPNCQGDPDGIECSEIDLRGHKNGLAEKLSAQLGVFRKLLRELRKVARTAQDRKNLQRFQDRIDTFQDFQRTFQASWPDTIGYAWHCFDGLTFEQGLRPIVSRF